ncbi:hypothetical protein WJX79_003458 [Trebouxia sp. C0005]
MPRSRSPSRSPRRGERRRDTTPMRREAPSRCSLLVRGLSKACRSEDLRYEAERYGPCRDVYCPRDYYTGEGRGLGFVEFTSPRDAEDAKYGMDRSILDGKEISVVFAMQGRKRPEDYRGVVEGTTGPATAAAATAPPPAVAEATVAVAHLLHDSVAIAGLLPGQHPGPGAQHIAAAGLHPAVYHHLALCLPRGTDKDVSSTYKQQCEAVLVQKRCAFSVLGDDEAMEGIPEQIVVACHYAQYYCLFPQHWVRSEAQAFKYSTVS